MKNLLAKIKNFFVKIGKSIAKGFNYVFKHISKFFKDLSFKVRHSRITTLVLMQLKDKWNFSFKENKKKAIFKLITYFVVFIAVCAICVVVISLATGALHIFVSTTLPHTALTIILTIIIIFEALSTLIGLTRSLYFSKDNQVLITYPVKADYIFVSKMIVYYLDALKRLFYLFIPVLVAFGITRGLPFYYYPWMLFMTVVFFAFIVVLCGFLSVPTYYIMTFLNKYKLIKVALALLLLGALIVATILLIDLIPTNINIIQEYQKFTEGFNAFLVWFSNTFSVMAAITAMFAGVKNGVGVKLFNQASWLVPLILLVGIALFIFVNMKLSKPFYTKMISNSNHFKPKGKKEKNNKKHSRFLSLIRYETIRTLRDEKIIISSLIVVIVTPLLILLVNRFYSSFDVRQMGKTFIVLFNFLFILILCLTHNLTSSYIFSKDGPSWNINKTIPVNPKESLTIRLVYNFVISLFIILPAGIIFSEISSFSPKDSAFFILSIIILSTFHSFLSASYDFMHSENKTKADIGSEIVSKHESISLVYALLISFLAFGFGFILFLTNTSDVFLRLFIFAIILLGLEVYLFFKRITALYQEN